MTQLKEVMPKHADLQPRWLVSLLAQWARRELHAQNGSIGYPSKSSFLLIHSSNPAKTDPTGECARDFRELEDALKDCQSKRPHELMALLCFYKPWDVDKFRALGWPFGNSTYFYRLHAAHKSVSKFILQSKDDV